MCVCVCVCMCRTILLISTDRFLKNCLSIFFIQDRKFVIWEVRTDVELNFTFQYYPVEQLSELKY